MVVQPVAAVRSLHAELGDVGAIEILSSEKQVASGETGLGLISGILMELHLHSRSRPWST